MNVLLDTIINIIDYTILFKYFDHFSEKRRIKHKQCWIFFLFCIAFVSVANQLNNQIINLIICIMMIYIYSFSFVYKLSYHIILPILYIGFGLVAELICFYLLENIHIFGLYDVNFYVSAFLCEAIRCLIVYIIYSLGKVRLAEISFDIGKCLFVIPVSSIVICCIAINIIQDNNINMISELCIAIIIMTVLSNIFMFVFFNKLLKTLQEKHNNEILLKEAEFKEKYYHELEKSNDSVREIKHNLKNVLLGMYGEYRNDNGIAEGIRKIVDELDNSDKNIYTSNVIINTILTSKINYAESININVDTVVKVPKSVKLDYRDTGVLIGNILDNAIEACERINESLRWIKISIVYKSNSLFIMISNSKDMQLANIEKTNKKDIKNHGIGIPSIKRIVAKHNGVVEFNDKGKEFEVSASLYGITSI